MRGTFEPYGNRSLFPREHVGSAIKKPPAAFLTRRELFGGFGKICPASRTRQLLSTTLKLPPQSSMSIILKCHVRPYICPAPSAYQRPINLEVSTLLGMAFVDSASVHHQSSRPPLFSHPRAPSPFLSPAGGMSGDAARGSC